MSDPTELTHPPMVYTEILAKILESLDGWDEPPQWGFFYMPSDELMRHFQEEHVEEDMQAILGVMAAPMPLDPQAWAMVSNPVEILQDFAVLLASPRNAHELEIGATLRAGKPAQVLGAWFQCEGWVPPPEMISECERRAKTGEAPVQVSQLPDRVEAYLAFGVDRWGRSYTLCKPRDGSEGMANWDDQEGNHCAQQPPNVALRAIVDLATTPIPREPKLA